MDGEKYGSIRRPRWQMNDFQTAPEFCNLNDLGFSGPKFTWCNMREGAQYTKERLDRATTNTQWQEIYSFSFVEVLATRVLDHAPIHVGVKDRMAGNRLWTHRFFYEAGCGKKIANRQRLKQVWRIKHTSGDELMEGT